jgi:hypothetical protein
VVVLVLVAVLWLVVLVAVVVAKLREWRSEGSVRRLHQRLDLFEGSVPKPAQPAFRLIPADRELAPRRAVVVVPPHPRPDADSGSATEQGGDNG